MTFQRHKRGIFGLAVLGLMAGCAPDSTAPNSTTPAALTVPSYAKIPAPNRIVDDDHAQCPTAGFTTIQSAVAASSPGDVIKVCAGLYQESVNIPISLTLLGAQAGKDGSGRKNTADATRESIIQPTSDAAISVVADGVIIDGFDVIEASGGNHAGIITSNAFSGYMIRNNIINETPYLGIGILFASTEGNPSIVERNYFDGHSDESGALSAVGVYQNGGDPGLHNATIRENTFFHNGGNGDNGTGINLLGNDPSQISNVLVERNKSIDDGSFIAMFYAPGTIITNNEVKRPTGSGIFVAEGNDNVVISYNKISDGQYGGVRVNASDFGGPTNSNLNISHNDIHNMGLQSSDPGPWLSGISAASSSMNNSLLSDNNSQNNGEDGIGIASGNSGNTINHNTMRGNAVFDAFDGSAGGGTAGTANTWTNNNCKTSSPAGLCK